MPKRVKLPNGQVGEFPDSMSNADIEGVLRKQFAAPAASASATPKSLKEKAKAVGRSITSAFPMIGGVAGGFVGGVAATPADAVGGPVPTMLGAAGGAALGGGWGESLRQMIDPHLAPSGQKAAPMTVGQRVSRIAKEGAVQGVGELAGGALSAALRPTLKGAIGKLYYATNLGAEHNGLIENLTDELANTATKSGKAPKTLGQFGELVQSAQANSNREYGEALAQPVTRNGHTVPLNDIEVMPAKVEEKIRALEGSHISEIDMNPARSKAIKVAASNYAKPRSFAWLNDRRAMLNAELGPYYRMTPAEKGIYRMNHPHIDIDAAEADAIRDTIYPMMDSAAGKQAGYFENLQRKNGMLKDLGKQLAKRTKELDVATKQAAGAPWYERGTVSAYATSGRTPRFTLHKLTAAVKSPNFTKRSDRAVASAFGRSVGSKVMRGAARVAPAASLPIRYIGVDSNDDQYIPQNAGEAKRMVGQRQF